MAEEDDDDQSIASGGHHADSESQMSVDEEAEVKVNGVVHAD